MLDHLRPSRDDVESGVSLKVQDSLWVQILHWLLNTPYYQHYLQYLQIVMNIRIEAPELLL